MVEEEKQNGNFLIEFNQIEHFPQYAIGRLDNLKILFHRPTNNINISNFISAYSTKSWSAWFRLESSKKFIKFLEKQEFGQELIVQKLSLPNHLRGIFCL